jgi:hypothetical protein
MSNTAVRLNAYGIFFDMIVVTFFCFGGLLAPIFLPPYFLKLLPHLIFNPIVTR